MTIPLYSGRYSDLARHLAARMAAQTPWPHGILVPSRAAAQEVVRALLALTPAGAASVALYTPENLARLIVNASGELPAVAGDAEREFAMYHAARGLPDKALPAEGLEAILTRSYRDIRDAGLTIEQIESRRGRKRPRHEMLFRAGRAYEDALRRMELIDPADLLARAANLLQQGATIPHQVVFGFYDMTGAQQKLLTALAGAGRVESFYFPVADPNAPVSRFASRFHAFLFELGAVSQPAEDSGPYDTSDFPVNRYQTPRDEIRGICRSIRELLDAGTPPGDIGIVCRRLDPDEADLVEQAATGERLAVTPRFALPLRAQRIGRACIRLVRMREARFPRSWTLEVLRDGLRSESVRGARALDRLDRLTRKHGIAGGFSGVAAASVEGLRAREPEAAEELQPFLAATQEIEAITAPFERPMTGPDWEKALLGLAGRFRAETDRDLQAIEAIEETAAMLRNGDALGALFDAEFVAGLLDSHSLPPPRVEGPKVWFGDVMTMRGRSFAHLFALGMQEDRFPQGRIPDPILTDADREAFGLPPIGDGRDEERLLYELVVQSAQRVHFSFAKTDGFGKVLRPSPFLPDRHAEIERPVPRPLPSFISPALARQLRLVQQASGRGEFSGYIEVDEAMRLEIRRRLETFSPTGFEDFGECPQKFLFRRLLRAEEMNDPEHEAQINYLDKGALDHRILERFYRQASDRLRFFSPRFDAKLPDDLRQALAAIVEEEFTRFDREHPPFNETIRGMERRFTMRNLERFLIRDIGDLRELGLEPIHFEFTFGTDRKGPPQYPAIPVRLDSMEIAFRGSIDRVDRTATQPYRYRVVDYKSGKALRHKNLSALIEAGHRLQLAIYAIAAEQIFDTPADSISGSIKPLGSPDANAEVFSFELAEHKEQLLDALETFVDSIQEGRFPAIPEDEGACRYCPLGMGCRTRHDAHERRALRRFSNALELLREEHE